MSESFATDRPDLPPADESPSDDTQRLSSPADTKGWTMTRQDGIETFTAPGVDGAVDGAEGVAYVRARTGEAPDLIVTFTRTLGLQQLWLVRADRSTTVRRATLRARREKRALRARGYDVD